MIMPEKVLVLGAGTMGTGIAMVYASHGFKTTLIDQTEELIQKAEDRILTTTETLVKDGVLASHWLTGVKENITYAALARFPKLAPQADLLVETVFERADVKKNTYIDIDKYCKTDCIICSNTSALNVFELAELRNPERFLITHWFNPPYTMDLVEIVAGPGTSDEVIEKVRRLHIQLGKTPAVIKQYIPGFIVNRLAATITREISHMILQGWATAEDIESAIACTSGTRYGFEGPIRLYDFVGWDIIQPGAEAIHPTLCNDTEGGNALARQLIAQGRFGIRAGKGAYDYEGVDLAQYAKERTNKILKMQKFLKDL